jgi:uncharacterized membrane protein YsdA (DUF1294 family)
MISLIFAFIVVVLLFKIFGGNKRAARKQGLQMRELVRAVNPQAAARDDRRVLGQKRFVYALFFGTFGIAYVIRQFNSGAKGMQIWLAFSSSWKSMPTRIDRKSMLVPQASRMHG